MNIKGIQGGLLSRAKADAILRGQTLTEWVMTAMEAQLEKANDGGLRTSEHREVLSKPDERTEPIAHRPDVAGRDEAADSGTPLCPEDGDPMIWNRVLKRFICACGYQGKIQR
jgi:hypothetical protein